VSNTVRLPPLEYEALPVTDRWMAHETLPAQAWFNRERRRIQCLIYLPVPQNGSSEVAYYYRASDVAHENQLITEGEDEDEDYVDDHDGTDDNESDDTGSSSSSADSEDDDVEVFADEVDKLRRSEEVGLPPPLEPDQAMSHTQSSSETSLHPLEYSFINAGVDKPEVIVRSHPCPATLVQLEQNFHTENAGCTDNEL
jgi:hypothetical protein